MGEVVPVAEWQLAALRGLDLNRLAWLLFFASRGSPIITTSKTDNLERIGPQVERFAHKAGFADVDVLEGYKRLCNAPVQGKKREEALFLRDKATRVCRYTDTGFALEGYLRSHPDVLTSLLKAIGETAEGAKEWFPFEHPRAAVQMVAISPAGVTTPYRMTVRARFSCMRCKNEITHEYSFTWEDERWNLIETQCERCGLLWGHLQGEPNTRPISQE